MGNIKFEDYNKYFFMLFFVVVLYLSFLLIRPFITAILASVILSYIFYPLYRKINKKLKKKNLSSFIVTILVILLITIPLVFAVNKISRDIYLSYVIVKQKVVTGNLFGIDCQTSDNLLCSVSNKIKEIGSDPKVRNYLNDTLSRLAVFIAGATSGFILGIPKLLLDIFIIFFVMFYLFKDGKEIVHKIKCCLPIKKEHQNKIYKKFNEMTYAVVYGNIITAIIQGLVGAIGFLIFGIPSALFWGLLMAFFALMPYIGTAIIWVPAALFQIASGYFGGNIAIFWKGVGLMIYGLVIISSVDNILKPKIIGTRAKVHPVFVLIGVVGGVFLFGFIGVVVGPLILTLLLTLFEIYEEDKTITK